MNTPPMTDAQVRQLGRELRSRDIAAGKIWVVYWDNNPDNHLHEGSRTACLRWLRGSKDGLWYAYKRNEIRLAKLIWEDA